LGLSITEPAQPAVVGAGFRIRALARVIDTVFGLAVGRVAGSAALVVLLDLEALSVSHPGWRLRIMHERMLLMLFGLVGVILYHTVCEGLHGSTLGKFVCGLNVLSEDCTPCCLWPAFVRSVGYFIDAIAFGLVAYLEMSRTLMEQRHGDHWVRTVVVKSLQVPEESKRSDARFFAVLVAGTCGWGFMLIASMVAIGLGL
jgi:uncharacterized RDD family membrane protein YckC